MARRLDACFVAVAGFAATFLLRQHTFYKEDGDVLLMGILEGRLEHPHHLLYKPLIAGLHRATAPLGMTLYEAGVTASALGTGVGVGCAYLASRWLGLTRGAALAVAALMLTVPALLFFGTVVELHGVFLGFAGPAFLASAALARSPRLGNGIALGAALALAYVGHASAGLLPVALLPLGFFYPQPGATWRRARQLLPPALVAGLLFAVALAVLPWLGRRTGLGVDTASAAAYVARDALVFAADAQRWGLTLRDEWLLPYAPLNALALAACVVGGARLQAAWSCLAVVPYYLLCVFLLPSAEFGAYLTPLAWPLALLAVRVAPSWLVLLLGIAGFAGGAAWIETHDRPELARQFAAGVRAAAGAGPPFLLLGDHEDVKATLIALPDVPHLLVLHAGSVPAAALPEVMRRLDEVLQRQWSDGRTVLLTDGAVRMLADVVPCGPRVVPALQARYRMSRVVGGDASAAFAGFRIDPR